MVDSSLSIFVVLLAISPVFLHFHLFSPILRSKQRQLTPTIDWVLGGILHASFVEWPIGAFAIYFYLVLHHLWVGLGGNQLSDHDGVEGDKTDPSASSPGERLYR